MNEEELRNMMYTAQLNPISPFTIRYPRGNGEMVDWQTPFTELEIGKGRYVSEGEDIAVLSVGTVGNFVQEAIKNTKDPEKKENLRAALKIWTDHLEKLKAKTKKMNETFKSFSEGEGKYKGETWEQGYKRRVVKTTDPEHKEKGYKWRIKGKERNEISIKLYKEKPDFAEYKKQMRRVAGHEFGG